MPRMSYIAVAGKKDINWLRSHSKRLQSTAPFTKWTLEMDSTFHAHLEEAKLCL
jgi:hypothetical protein